MCPCTMLLQAEAVDSLLSNFGVRHVCEAYEACMSAQRGMRTPHDNSHRVQLHGVASVRELQYRGQA